MRRPPRLRETASASSVSPLSRLLNTAVIAGIGVAAGLAYAYATVPGVLTERQRALYGTLGAVIAVLGVRLATIIRAVLLDYFGQE